MRLLFILLSFCFLASCGNDEKRYCGKVIEQGKEEPTSGHKSSRDAVYYVVIYDEEARSHIRVNVNVPTYYSLEKGKTACFMLTARNLGHYGNGYKHLK